MHATPHTRVKCLHRCKSHLRKAQIQDVSPSLQLIRDVKNVQQQAAPKNQDTYAPALQSPTERAWKMMFHPSPWYPLSARWTLILNRDSREIPYRSHWARHCHLCHLERSQHTQAAQPRAQAQCGLVLVSTDKSAIRMATSGMPGVFLLSKRYAASHADELPPCTHSPSPSSTTSWSYNTRVKITEWQSTTAPEY